jgi:hypothetical protein
MIHVSGHPLYKSNPELIKDKAKGYIVKEEGIFKERDWVYVPAYPSGAADGTVAALAKFALALTPKEAIESPLFETSETFNQLFSRSYAPDEIKTSIAHGFWEFDGAKYHPLDMGKYRRLHKLHFCFSRGKAGVWLF